MSDSDVSSNALAPSDISAWLRFSFAGLKPNRARAALERLGTPQNVFEAALSGDEELTISDKLTEKAISKLRECAARNVSQQLEAMEMHGILLLLDTDDAYPRALRATPDAPPYLFVRGDILEADERAVAIVGTRNVTEYGRGLAHRFALELAHAGVTVVSGLARGIDTAAHRGSLDGKGRTLAVTGCGLDIVYPSDNKDLMLEIENQGAVISEWAPTTNPEAWHFPARNRIIAGLSLGVIVVEAAAKSGALITADFANELGREVFAVPGNIHKTQSRGPHQLIRDGATLIESVEDVLQALEARTDPWPESTKNQGNGQAEPTKPNSRPAKRPLTPRLETTSISTKNVDTSSFSPDENKIWVCLDVEARHIDDLAEQAGLGASQVNTALVLLELKGAARRLPGNLFARVV
ncbi:DNA protecting protein DprA [Abditibacterium utsteinense]|uniref:DNA protecting protein DprA n=1 Tax=Abditibacterium utsteinense TaxID=1960156 RepID=A0A2S8SVE8_9BACT|nr:DNA-processing protein DprA [Abditibacterium utsteinense]PQV64770.1 DNA protecting protein DprA [Abditibacterium utsteinense]